MTRPRILAVDIGTGTQDILIFEAGTLIENAVQLVMPSPTALVADRVKQATADRADLFLTGVMMGGGPDHWAVEAHLREGLRVYATPDAARTFDDDLGRVEAMGVRLVDSADRANGARRLEMRDFYGAELMDALRAFGVSTVFDAVAAAVFDHGAAPPGVSDRRFRFDYLREQVERGTGLAGFGFLSGEVPSRMTRMEAVARTWTGSEPLFLMDTGPAAILGALDDGRVGSTRRPMVANLGNFHTIATLLDGQRITPTHNSNYANFDVGWANREIEALTRRPELTPEVDSGWAALDRKVMRLAPWAPFLNQEETDFFSPRVELGCYVNSVLYEFDYASICVKK